MPLGMATAKGYEHRLGKDEKARPWRQGGLGDVWQWSTEGESDESIDSGAEPMREGTDEDWTEPRDNPEQGEEGKQCREGYFFVIHGFRCSNHKLAD